MGCVSSWDVERLAKKKTLLEVLENTALGLAAGTIESYTLDTGQTRQSVTKSNIDVLNRVIESLENQIVTLQTRIYGCGVHTGRPAF